MRQVGQAIEAKLTAPLLAAAIKGVYTITSTGDLVINISSHASRAVLVTGITILWDDNTVTILDRWNDTSTANIKLMLIHPDGTHETLQGLPAPLAPGDTLTIALQGYALNREPVTISASLSASPVVAIIAVKHAAPQANVTIIQGYPAFARLMPENLPPLNGYTVAIPATLYAVSTANNVYASSYEIVAGNYEGGDLGDTMSRDGSALRLSSSQTYKCLGPEWPYYREITIENPYDVTFSDIAISINLSASNFDFAHANSDGSDIRILTEDCTALPFWIETWDNVNQQATIWVRIPSLPPGETKLLIFYGNPSATSASDIRSTFLFAEDLEVDYNGDGVIDDNDMIYAGWSIVSERNGLWHVASPSVCNSISHNWYYGRDTTCDYNVGVTRGYIRTPQLNLPSVEPSAALILRFYTRWQHESYPSGNYDSMDVDVSTDGGDTWTTLWHRDCNEGPSFADWHWEQIDLTSYAGQSIYIRFRFDSVDELYNNYEGWHVDNIILAKTVIGLTVTVGPELNNIAYVGAIKLAYPYIDVLYGLRLYAASNTTVPLNYSIKLLNENLTIIHSESGSFTSTLEVEKQLTSVTKSPIYLVIRVEGSEPFIFGVDEAVIVNATLGLSSGMLIANSGNLAEKLIFFNFASNITMFIDVPQILLGLPSNYTALAQEPAAGGLIWVARYIYVVPYDSINQTWLTNSIITLSQPVQPGAVLASNGTHLYFCPGNGSSTIYVYSKDGTLVSSIALPVGITSYSSYAVCNDVLYIHTGTTGRLIAVSLFNASILSSSSAPVLYIAGMDCDGRYIWIITKGGGIVYYDTMTDRWIAPSVVLPYAPLQPGDRLVVTPSRLYHVRDDGTNEILIMLKPT